VVDLAQRRAIGVEALLRWEHPEGGLLPPDDFLPAVAHTPVMAEITSWVVRTALEDLTAWPGWTMSVNITALDATRPELADEVLDSLAAVGIPPYRLVLELTEQAMLQNLEVAVSALGRLREAGVGLSLDDFGTGYSSLLYLRDLPLTAVKIDRTFLAGVPDDAENLAIVRSVAQLGRAVRLDVVAEGIETLPQARAALDASCTHAQGYLWGRPEPAGLVDQSSRLQVPQPARRDVAPGSPPRSLPAERAAALLADGASLHTIAAALNREGLRTDKGVRWSARSVALLVSR
jgi:EAL domain-containing protein (putative c-di-GMP-specific phosphodiesterase class I)